MYAVLFDIDGTLLHTGGSGHSAFAEIFREIFGLDEMPKDIPFAGRSDRAIVEEIMQCGGIGVSEENWEKFFAEYQQRLGRVLSLCKGQLLPGVLQLLDTLGESKTTVIGLLTGNTEFGAKAKTEHYGLADRFAFGGYGDNRTNRDDIAADAKQAAEAYVYETHSDKICGTMVIGDTPADVQCGRAIDAYVVAVATGSHTLDELAVCQPDLLVENLTDSEALLAEVFKFAP